MEDREQTKPILACGPQLIVRAAFAVAVVAGLVGFAFYPDTENADPGSPYADPPAVLVQTS